MFKIIRLLTVAFILLAQTSLCLADRIKDLTSLAGIRSNQLVGYGVVVGLAGTGDGNTGITLQSMQSLVSRFGVTSGLDGFNGDNAAAVMLTADLPPFTKPGQPNLFSPEESVRHLINVINEIEPSKNGFMLSWDGSIIQP